MGFLSSIFSPITSLFSSSSSSTASASNTANVTVNPQIDVSNAISIDTSPIASSLQPLVAAQLESTENVENILARQSVLDQASVSLQFAEAVQRENFLNLIQTGTGKIVSVAVLGGLVWFFAVRKGGVKIGSLRV